MIRSLSVLFAVLVIGGCSNSNDPATDLLSAHAENRTVTLVNTTDEPVYYFVANKDILALLDWSVCLEPSKCTAVAPRSEKKIAYSDIAVYQEGAENAVVYHWRLISKPEGKYGYDQLRTLDVKLR